MEDGQYQGQLKWKTDSIRATEMEDGQYQGQLK